MLKRFWQKISGYDRKHPRQSVRRTAEQLGVSKDMVHRTRKRTERRVQFSESDFWESAAGQDFIKRLMVSAIYTFGIKGGVGAGRIEEFMQQIRIGTHAGISESSIYRMMKEIEAAILRYRELVEQQLTKQANEQLDYLEVVLGLDETWLDNMLLVCQDLSSGYLFLNSQRQNATPTVGTSPSKTVSNDSD